MKETPGSVPSGLGLTALDPAFREDPSSVLDLLRSSEPVHKDRTFDRIFLTRAKDIAAVLNDRTLSSDPRKSRPGSFSRVQLAVDENFRPTMLHLDDPDDSPVFQLDRVCPYAKAIDGVTVEAGQTITSSLHSANHDPAVYQDPHIFNPERAEKHHYSFGGGPHYCIGAPLARAEAQIGLLALFERFPKIRLSHAGPAVRKSIPGFNGLESLHVEVS